MPNSDGDVAPNNQHRKHPKPTGWREANTQKKNANRWTFEKFQMLDIFPNFPKISHTFQILKSTTY